MTPVDKFGFVGLKMAKLKLEDVCEFITDGTHQTPTYCEDGGFLFLSSKDVTSRKIDWEKAKHIPRDLHEKLYERLAPKRNDILLAKNGTTGVAAIVDRDEVFDVYVSLAVLRPNREIVPQYLLYAVNSPVAKRQFDAGLKGVGVPNLHLSVIRNTEINVCEYERQIAICNLLDKITKIITVRQQQLAKLDELIKARFVEMFGDPVANTLGWKQALLSEVSSKIGSGATPKGGKESYQAEGITLIRSMNVHDGRFEYKDLAHITDAQAEQLNNVTVEEGDVFINITGASVARSCVVPLGVLPARVNQHVAIIRCIRTQLHPIFANNMFLNDRFKAQLLNIGESGGATRQAITKQQLENLTVILPPIELQNDFAAFIVQVDKSKVAVQKALDEAQLLFDSLMQQYFG